LFEKALTKVFGSVKRKKEVPVDADSYTSYRRVVLGGGGGGGEEKEKIFSGKEGRKKRGGSSTTFGRVSYL